MGYYIEDQPEMSKNQLMAKYGKLVEPTEELVLDRTKVLVCLVDNVVFYAAGVAYNVMEMEAFSHPDNRRKDWYLLDVKDVIEQDMMKKDTLKHLNYTVE